MTAKVLTLDRLLEDTIAAVLAVLDEAPEASPFLTFEPLERRQRTLEAIKRLLIRESQIQPLLVVVEDLHWIDSETQALLDGLVESLPSARILLLVNYRPEYHHSWGSKACYAQVRVDPLTPGGAEEFLDRLAGPEPRAGAAQAAAHGAHGQQPLLPRGMRAHPRRDGRRRGRARCLRSSGRWT